MVWISRKFRHSLFIHAFPRLLAGFLFIYFYCDYLIYIVYQIQCEWPTPTFSEVSGVRPVYAMILADPLLGHHSGHWFDRWRREWQMHRAFQTAVLLHKPDVVFVLGDLFYEGHKKSENEFNEVVQRFYQLFKVPAGTSLHAVAGNHDIGFHYNKQFEREAQALGPIASDKLHRITPQLAARFESGLGAAPVRLVSARGNHFVLLNSMALQGDGCSLCARAAAEIENIADILKCSRGSKLCKGKTKLKKYSRPILIQHFPLYRASDAQCSDDEIPAESRLLVERWDCLAKESTEYLVERLRPRRAFGAHTRRACVVPHSFAPTPDHKTEFLEYTVPSFSWANTRVPMYYLLRVTPEEAHAARCSLPREGAAELSAALLLLALALYLRRWLAGRPAPNYKLLSGKKV